MADDNSLGQAFDDLGAKLAAATEKSRQTDIQVSLAALRTALDDAEKPPSNVFKALWDKFKHPRHPKGEPDGGKFAGLLGFHAGKPKPAAKVTSSATDDWWKKSSAYAAYSDGTGLQKPKAHPAGAIQHPAVDNHGDAVTIDYPTKPSPNATYRDPKASITFVPNGEAPGSLNGVSTALAYKPPMTDAEWLNVPGQNPAVELGMPPLTAPKGQHIGAGVLIEEPDGRVWLVSPTNRFGGYHQTFPKGTYEDGIASLQANAIKEAFEESGLQIEITGLLGDFKRTTSVARFYTAKRIGGSPAHMGWESQAVRLVPLPEARKWLNRKEVDHPVLEAFEALRGIEHVEKGFDEAKHDRWPKGSPLGGQFKDSFTVNGFTPPPKIGWKKDGSGPGANATYYNQMKAAFDAATNGNMAPAKKLVTQYDTFAEKFGIGAKQNSHGKWKAQVHQYAFDLLVKKQDMDTVQQSASVVEGKLGPQSIGLWKKVGEKPGGTAPGALYTDELGQKWLVKGNVQKVKGTVTAAVSDERARNEVLSAKLMAAAGIPAPEYKLVDLGKEYGGGLGVATKWEDGLSPVIGKSQRLAAQDQFAVHAWLGNWDAWGMTGDNMLVRPNGEIVNIDPGGSLLFRAQGLPKAKGAFGPDAADWESMRTMDPGKAIFGDMKQYQLDASAEHLNGLTDQKISALVFAHGPGSTGEKAVLAATLIDRRKAIMEKAGLIVGLTPAAAAATTPNAPIAVPSSIKIDPAKPKVGDGWKPLGAAEWKPIGDAKNSVAEPGFVSTIGAEDAIKGLKSKEALMGPPDPVMVPVANMVASSWINKGQNAATPAQKWDAMMVATYASGLSNFHTSGNSGDMAVLQNNIGAVLYDTNADYEAALKQFGESGGGYNDAEGFAAQMGETAKPVDSNMGYTDAGALNYKMGAFAVAHAGQEPEPPNFGPDQKAYAGDIKTLQDYAAGKGTLPGTAKHLAEGTFYANKGDEDLMSPNTAALSAYGQALMIYHSKTDKELLASIDKPVRTPSSVKPAMPDFEDAKLDASNKNAPSHNKKVDLIAKLASVGNVSGILGLNYGTNTYGKQQVVLANDVLAALGSPEKVSIGQGKLQHPAVGGPAMAKAAEAVVEAAPPPPKKVTITKADLPPKPVFSKSGKAWKNEQNNAEVDEIETLALAADLKGLDAMTYEVKADDADGTPTGEVKPTSEHASPIIQNYWSEAYKAVDDKLNPPKPLVPFKTEKASSLAQIAELFPPAPLLTTVKKLPKNQQIGFWATLGNVDASPAAFTPPGVTVGPQPGSFIKDQVPATFYQKVKDAYAKASATSKAFMSSVQGSGAINQAYNDGATAFNIHGKTHNLEQMAVAMAKDAIEIPEGKTIYKWLRMEPHMQEAIKASAIGTVLQNPGSACASMNATSTEHFAGSDISKRARVVFRAAKGARAMPSWGSGGYDNEKELTTLPGARMVILGTRKMPSQGGLSGWFEIEVALLPPHKNSLKTKT